MICRYLLRLIAIPTIVIFVLFLVIQPEAIDGRGGGGGGRGGGGGSRSGGADMGGCGDFGSPGPETSAPLTYDDIPF